MSLNCTLLHVRDLGVPDLGPAGLLGTGTFTPVEDAVSAGFTGLAAVDDEYGVTLLSGSPEYVALLDRIVDTLDVEVVAALFSGVSSTWGWFVVGPGARRELAFSEGARAQDVGAPLAEEEHLTDLDEDSLLALFCRRTGRSLSDWWSDGARAEILQPGAVGKRRSLFRRRR